MNSPEYRKKFLFIDDSCVFEVDNLRRTTNQAVKHPEPVFRMDAPWDGPEDEFNGMNVVYDPQDKLFKMWYTVLNISRYALKTCRPLSLGIRKSSNSSQSKRGKPDRSS